MIYIFDIFDILDIIETFDRFDIFDIFNIFDVFDIFDIFDIIDLLPPKLQRRGLVFKGKMGYFGAFMMGYYVCVLRVTMERVK